uniref:PARP-type domain-containing protein n=1 Tax=Panagrolaimus sp. PS1159 TaxID=55785 RepID=A0AC35G1A9_9BILA
MLNQKSYFFQYSKSNDSFCQSCNEIIAKDELRVYRNDHYEIYPYPTNGWFHYSCFWRLKESKNISTNDVMLEIEYPARNYAIGSWKYQWKNMTKNDIYLSLNDGQSTCFYTSLAFYDTTNTSMVLGIEEKDIMEIRKKIAEVKDSTKTLNTSSSSSATSGYASAEDLSKSPSPSTEYLTADETYEEEDLANIPTTTATMKNMDSNNAMDYYLSKSPSPTTEYLTADETYEEGDLANIPTTTATMKNMDSDNAMDYCIKEVE